MKTTFRAALFNKIRSEMLKVSGKQSEIATALAITQNDVSLIKLGRDYMLSTDKLIDIAQKCGWSFSFELVQGDRTAITGAVSKGEADFAAHMESVFGGED